jgi:hypothetical protein
MSAQIIDHPRKQRRLRTMRQKLYQEIVCAGIENEVLAIFEYVNEAAERAELANPGAGIEVFKTAIKRQPRKKLSAA